MLTISVLQQTEQNVRQLAMISSVLPEDVCRVLLALPFSPSPAAPAIVEPRYRTTPDLSDDEYSALIESLGHQIPSGASTLEGVDLRELAYAGN